MCFCIDGIALKFFDLIYNMMPEENKSILSDFIAGKTHLKQRLRLFNDRRFRCSDRETYHNFQLAVLMNIY